MAITRRSAVEHGISYGTAMITFKNDALAYQDALRALPEDDTFDRYKEALQAGDAEQAKTLLRSLRQTFAHLALSDLVVAATTLETALTGEELPSVEECEQFEGEYRVLIEWLGNC